MTLTILLLACTVDPADEATPPHVPRFADVNFAADGYIDLVDRHAALDHAMEESAGGAPIDFLTASDFFRVDLDSEDLQALAYGVDLTEVNYQSLLLGMTALQTLDLAVATRLGPMGNVMGAYSNLTFQEYEDWFWSATQAVTNDEGATVTSDFNVHWVGTGWLVEVLQTSEDDVYYQDTWFAGYYQADGALGWWDFYRSGGVMVTMEYLGNVGDGQAQLYWPSTDDVDDEMTWQWNLDGSALVDWQDSQPPPNAPLPTRFEVHADQSGTASLPDYDGVTTACWDSSLVDVDCP